jgi:hypothetical protein
LLNDPAHHPARCRQPEETAAGEEDAIYRIFGGAGRLISVF